MKLRFLGAGLLVLLLGACATVPPSYRDERVRQVVSLLIDAPIDAVVEQSSIPFLFTDQVVSSQADLVAVLGRFRATGVTLEPLSDAAASDSLVRPPRTGADSRFDVKVFYDRLPDDARLVQVESSAGPLLLILGGERGRRPLIMGILRGTL